MYPAAYGTLAAYGKPQATLQADRLSARGAAQVQAQVCQITVVVQLVFLLVGLTLDFE